MPFKGKTVCFNFKKKAKSIKKKQKQREGLGPSEVALT